MARSTRPYQVLPPDPRAPKRLPPEQVAAMRPAEQDQMRRRHAQWRAEQDFNNRQNSGVPLMVREPAAAMNPGPLIAENARRVDDVVGAVASGAILDPIRSAASNIGLNVRKAAAQSPEEKALVQARHEAAMLEKRQGAASRAEAARSELAAMSGAAPAASAVAAAPAMAGGQAMPDLPDTINNLRDVTTQWENMRKLLRDPNLSVEQKRDIQIRMDALANQGRDLRSTMPRERGVPSPSLLSDERIANARNISDFDPAAFGTPEQAAEFRAGLDQNESRFQQIRQQELPASPVAARNDLARASLAEGEGQARDRRVAQATNETRMAAQRAEQMQSARDAAELRTLQSAGTTPGVAGSTLDAAVAGASALAEAMSGSRLAKIPAEAAGQFNVQVRQLASAADQLALLAPDERRQAALDLLTSLGSDAATLSAKLSAGSKLDDQSRALYEQALEVVSRITEMAG